MPHIQLQWLNVLHEEDQGQMSFSLPVNIGRAPGNDLVLTDEQKSISRKHATLNQEEGRIILNDCHSTNGIYIGRRKIRKTIIKDGATFRLGVYDITLTRQIQCSNPTCQRLVDSQTTMCPWCGRFLTEAITREIGDWR